MPGNENKFLVTWVDSAGNIRGQATKIKTDAKRMFDFVIEQGAQWAEVRKIGSVVYFHEIPPQIATAADSISDEQLAEMMKGKPN